MTKNATAAHTCAPSPKQSTRDWIRRLVGLIPSVTPLGKLPAPHIGARGAIWAHIQECQMKQTQQPDGRQQEQEQEQQCETTQNNNTP